MADYKRYSEYTDSKFWEVLEKSDMHELMGMVQTFVKNANNLLKAIPTELQHYTLHDGETHSLNVLTWMDIIAKKISEDYSLTLYECALAIMLAYGHDIGLILPFKKLEDIRNNKDENYQEYVKKNKIDLWIKYNSSTLSIEEKKKTENSKINNYNYDVIAPFLQFPLNDPYNIMADRFLRILLFFPFLYHSNLNWQEYRKVINFHINKNKIKLPDSLFILIPLNSLGSKKFHTWNDKEKKEKVVSAYWKINDDHVVFLSGLQKRPGKNDK